MKNEGLEETSSSMLYAILKEIKIKAVHWLGLVYIRRSQNDAQNSI